MNRSGLVLGRIYVILILALIILPILCISTPVTGAPEQIPAGPEVTLRLLAPEQNANIAPGEDGFVRFHGIASADNIGPNNIKVYMSSIDTWANSHVEPSILEFSPNDRYEKAFVVTVPVPRYTCCDEIGTLEVFGDARLYPSMRMINCEPVSGIIYVQQYHQFQISVLSDKYIRTNPGDEVEFDLMIYNEGNGRNTFVINTGNEKELFDKDFIIEVSERRFEISEFSEKRIKIKVHTPSDLDKHGKQDIRIAITSSGNNETMTITQYEVLMVGVDYDSWVYLSLYISIPIIIIVCLVVGYKLRARRRAKKGMIQIKIE
jgi:hypothetical protein